MLSKLFGKKKSEEEDEFDPEDFDDTDIDVEDLDDHVRDDEKVAHEDIEEQMVGGSDYEADNPFDDDDDDYDYEDEEDEAASRRKAILFAAVGAGVVLLSAVGGAGWWFFSTPDAPEAVVESELVVEPGRVEMAMPAAPGSLNSGGGDAPGTTLNTLNQSATEQPTTPADSSAPSLPQPVQSTIAEEAAAADTSASFAEPVAPLNSLNNLNALDTAQAGGGLVVPAVANSSLARIPDDPAAVNQNQALNNAPIDALQQKINDIGEVPQIGNNGVAPWQAYARPSDPDISNPKIALLFEGIGLSRAGSLGAINKLPPEVGLALSPYGRDLPDWVFRARLAGHELFMAMPMESEEFPLEDPGPLGLDTRVQVAENQRRLDTIMASAGGYVGMVTQMGSRFMKADGQLRAMLETIRDRGLMIVIGGNRSRTDATFMIEELNMVRGTSEFYIDNVPRIQQVRVSLDRLESIARENGFALAMARPYPVTIQSVLDWIATLEEKGIALVPPSAVAITQPAASQ